MNMAGDTPISQEEYIMMPSPQVASLDACGPEFNFCQFFEDLFWSKSFSNKRGVDITKVPSILAKSILP